MLIVERAIRDVNKQLLEGGEYDLLVDAWCGDAFLLCSAQHEATSYVRCNIMPCDVGLIVHTDTAALASTEHKYASVTLKNKRTLRDVTLQLNYTFAADGTALLTTIEAHAQEGDNYVE